MSMYKIYSVAGLLLDVGLTQSPSEEVPQYFGRVLWALLTGGQSVALWEEEDQYSFCLFTAPVDGAFPFILGGASKCLLRAMNQALLAVCGSLLSLWESSELPLVTRLAFSNLSLGLLGGTLLMGGGSGVEVPRI